jgi:predicted amidophosphoribosyltransferase
MKKLSASERHVNLKKAFNIVQNDVKLKNIIIIDDIYTTGSTVDHMTWQLKKGPASSVYVLTLAIGQTA